MFMNLGVMAEYWIDSEAMILDFLDSLRYCIAIFFIYNGKTFHSKLYFKK